MGGGILLGFSEIRSRAITFAYEWREANYEMGQSQSFWIDFFTCFGISPKRVATFEERVKKLDGKTGRIDMLWKGVLLIEQKSRGQDLDKAYTQAMEYFPGLADHELPQYILVCDFYNFHLYDVVKGTDVKFILPELPSKVELFGFMIGQIKERPIDYERVNISAAEKMAKLHDSLKIIGYDGEELETYLVRLLFCLFADDTGIFDKNIFYDLIKNTREDGSDLAETLDGLFVRLNTPEEKRLKIEDRFTYFPYINGDLFETRLPNAAFDKKMRDILLSSCNFDWGHITPSIFGSLFQAAMSPEARRAMGAHYTEEANILKVINPLFMDELKAEFELVKNSTKKLEQFHDKLAKLTFLDPACGTGNFLIIAYRELRTLELEVIEAKHKDIIQTIMDVTDLSKINVDRFYGLEIDPLAAEIARVGMWLCDHQCNMALSQRFGMYFVRLPLKTKATITIANALKMDWPVTDYILGNPPFVGNRHMNKEHRNDISLLFPNAKTVDYVAGWYLKSAKLMYINNNVKTALVSTNSVVQGEQPVQIWKPIFDDYGMKIDFAYRTFIWTSAAKGKAAVHCVIVGFSHKHNKIKKVLYDGELIMKVQNINAYLVDAPNILIQGRTSPISSAPKMVRGSDAVDGGHLLLDEMEYKKLLKQEPLSKKYIKQVMGGTEFINNKLRYCLWLIDCPPSDLKKMSLTLTRVEKCRQCRINSTSEPTRKAADTPSLFMGIRQPNSNYIFIPQLSSERRSYIPIGFLHKDIIALGPHFMIPNATMYHFGVLTSSIHMSWVRTVCGRLKSDYRYSKDIVYNNFPWPAPTDKQKEAIEKAAQAVLDTRKNEFEKDPKATLATLYNPTLMPKPLSDAHKKLDRAVAKAYGDKRFATEAERVADLMERYQELMEE